MARKQRGSRFPLAIVVLLLVLVAAFLFVSLHLHSELGSHSSAQAELNRPVNIQPVAQQLHYEQPVHFPKPDATVLPMQQVTHERQLTGVAAVVRKAQEAKAAAAMLGLEPVKTTTGRSSTPEAVTWRKHPGKSCQNYLDDDSTDRSLADSKVICAEKEACVAVECPGRSEDGCTLRAVANFVDFPPVDCYEKVALGGNDNPTRVHPAYQELLQMYAFQQVTTQNGQQVNIILVRAPFRSPTERESFERYKNDILFMGISSFEDYPLDAGNPFSMRFSENEYRTIFPGFLHMMREPEQYFPPQIKTILMSQSDFSLPDVPARDYSIPRKYDFTLSGSDQDVHNDCVGWSSFAKNWSFVKESLAVMCGEYKLKGVLVATKDKQGRKACTIPDSCKGLMTQTTFLNQDQYFNYLKQSRFAYLPQVHDASPRVSTQALAHDVPLLMNRNIKGGWKYLNEKTGEFFHDMSDFRKSLEKILKGADTPYHYEPRKWVLENYGNRNSGKRLYKFVKDNFADRNLLPRGTTHLYT